MQYCKILKKLPDFAIKCYKLFFVFGIMLSNPSARLENLRWPEMIVKLRNNQKF